jgi:hypothetical protein
MCQLFRVLDWVVCANGIYDVVCALSILFLPNTWIFRNLAQLHPTIFSAVTDQINPILRRTLAYWLITYGIVRVAVVRCDDVIDYLIASTYFLEAAAFTFEHVVHGTTQRNKVVWVACSSILLGTCILMDT